MNILLTDRPLTVSLPEGWDLVDLSQQTIAPCLGCFGCWTKTPGRCVLRDDAVTIYPRIAKSSRVLYVSAVVFGGYDVPMKTMLERAIPIQKPYIRLLDGETHHVQRDVAPQGGRYCGLRRRHPGGTGPVPPSGGAQRQKYEFYRRPGPFHHSGPAR